MSKIAFLGLGMMGSPIAGRLIDAGHDVTVWNRTTQRTEPFAHTSGGPGVCAQPEHPAEIRTSV